MKNITLIYKRKKMIKKEKIKISIIDGKKISRATKGNFKTSVNIIYDKIHVLFMPCENQSIIIVSK